MARYDGKQAAKEYMVEVAKFAAAAAYKAPQVTGVVKIETEIVTEEDQGPIIEFYEAIAPIAPVMFFDGKTFRELTERGEPPVFVLVGADLTRSELGWDCGACGFETCGEFNRYAKEHKSKGGLWGGPTCQWKLIDYAAACDFVAAAAWQSRLDCRVMGTLGAAAGGVGFMPECSAITGMPIGPPRDTVYFLREQNIGLSPQEDEHYQKMLRSIPTHWVGFPGHAKPVFKGKDKWWGEHEWLKWSAASEEEKRFEAEVLEKVGKVSTKHAAKIGAWYKARKKK